jgi:hypothetical protein
MLTDRLRNGKPVLLFDEFLINGILDEINEYQEK